MPSAISIDTNIVLRLCVGDVPAQVEAANHLLAKHAQVHISDLAISEAVFVLSRNYKFSRTETAETIIALLTQPSITCNFDTLQNALRHYVDHSGLSFEDCYLAAEAHAANAAPLMTFDKKLAGKLQHAQLLTSS